MMHKKMKTIWPLELLEDERLCIDHNKNIHYYLHV